jgi:hypothetical protein
MGRRCQQCGRPVDDHDRDVRFRVPDPLLDVPGWEDLPDTWLSHGDPVSSVLLQVPEEGGFVRCLLPVHLTGGYRVTFGVWLAIHPDDLRRTYEVWWEDTYADLRLDGRLANGLPGWGLLGAPATAAVRDVDHTPYLVASTDPVLARVLTDEWPHEPVLAALPT